jgi:RNA polymerase sigma-70 factor (ECF subfamily)
MRTLDAEASDQADMQELAAGGEAALNRLMDRHAAAVYNFLFRMLGNEEDAHDLAQATFVRVYQNRARFNLQARFTSWLFTIAGNLARNHHRWRSRHPTLPLEAGAEGTDQSLGETLPAAGVSPSEAALEAERAAAVRAAVVGLSPDLREAVILCEWQELSIAGAAALLKATPKAVESRLYRARQILRTQLHQWL